MTKPNFPFRPSNLDERIKFYSQEFSIRKISEFFQKNNIKKPQLCALDAGTESKKIENRKWENTMFYFSFAELKDKIMKYNPEDIYYDRNIYENPSRILKNLRFENHVRQELVFDIDSENIKCKNLHKKYGVCDKCLQKSYKAAVSMRKSLLKIFKRSLIVYSGRGFHLHILDEKAYLLSNKERIELNKKFSNFPIDPWVSAGKISLIRMPYSLNGLVSMIVTPIYKIEPEFDVEKYIPKFLKDKY